MSEQPSARFWWAVLLACAPWVATLIEFGYVLRDMWTAKATGLAVVTGGFAEMLVLWGFATMLVSQFVAIVWLWRSVSRNDFFRNVVGVASIAMSGLMLVLMVFFARSAWLLRR